MSNGKLSFLATILKPLGLSDESISKVIDFISDLLFEKDEETSKIEYPYQLVDEFLSPAELNFFLNLKSVIGDSAHVLSKVKLGDLFFAKTGDFGKNRSYMNRIERKHVDFLVCNFKTLKPILGIELDDKSHQRADRQEWDDFVNHVFAAAKLPLLHIPVRQAYSSSELKNLLAPYFPNNPSVIKEFAPLPAQSADEPLCPKCGSSMVLRTATRGDNQGGKFWGCSKYPECRGVLEYKSTP